MEQEEKGLTRRQVLRGAAGTGIALLLPMLADRVEAAATPEAWTNIGKAAQFKLNEPLRVAVAAGGVLYVTRTGPGLLTAVSARCTHRGCEVGWNGTGKQFVCPCHGAAFTSAGQNIHGTQRSPDEKLPALASLPVRQKAGQVQVNLQAVPAQALVPGRQS